MLKITNGCCSLIADYVSSRLYWIDAKIHMIVSTDLDGKNRQVILRGHQHLGHPFAITVFEVCACVIITLEYYLSMRFEMLHRGYKDGSVYFHFLISIENLFLALEICA